MIFTETALPGAFMIDLEVRADARGFFARAFSADEFRVRGLAAVIVQENLSLTRARGSVRGLHFQFPPAAEAKIVRCIRGAMFDVIVDLRPESGTYLQHAAIELSAANRRALYVPHRFAHGFQTLADETETWYGVTAQYAPELEGGLLYSDAGLGIPWPLPVADISDRDRRWDHLDRSEPLLRQRMQEPRP